MLRTKLTELQARLARGYLTFSGGIKLGSTSVHHGRRQALLLRGVSPP
jgi:hypothetical protein